VRSGRARQDAYRLASAPGMAVGRGCRAKRLAARTHKQVARQRQETGRIWAKKVVGDHHAIAVEDFRPRFLAKTTMARKAADAAIAATKRALVEMGRKHGRDVRLVHPAYTTVDCSRCVARTTHALPLGERVYRCTECGVALPRDKNSAHVMLIRAGLAPAGVDRTRPDGPPGARQREPGIPRHQAGEEPKEVTGVAGCGWVARG